MSLLYWLPLINDAHNQGLNGDTTTIMGSGITYTPGKLGNAATFPNNANSCLNLPGLQLQTGSWCVWLKCIGEGSGAYQFALSEGRDSGFGGINIRLAKAGTSIYAEAHKVAMTSQAISLNTWYHIAFTFGDNILKFYINGNLVETKSYSVDTDFSNSSNRFVIGKMAYSYTNTGNYFPFNGQINDVRIYNHCLSDKEIKEIAKGLVLHYKLDTLLDYTSTIPNNYQLLEYLESTGTQYIDTQIVPQTNFTYNFKYALMEFDGYKGPFVAYNSETANTVRLIPNNGSSTDVFLYFQSRANRAVSVGGLTSATGQIIEGTLSQKHYRLENLTTGIIKESSSSTDLFTVKGSELTATMKLFGADSTSVSKSRIYYFDTLENNICIQQLNPVKRLSDNTLGFYDTINNVFYENIGSGVFTAGPVINFNNTICDYSGYNNNGIINGFLSVTTDTPRYSHSITFNNGAYSKKTDIIFTSNYWSISCWFKKTSNITNAYEVMVGLTRANGNDSNKKFSLYVYNNKIGCVGEQTSYANIKIFDTSLWHHACLVNNAGNFTYYMDGIIIKTFSNSNCLTDCTDFVVGGRAAIENAASIGAPWGGNLSDVRLYATALSTEDILDLYHTPVAIDNKGNGYAREIIEDTSLNITKTGQFHNNELLDDDTFTTASITKTGKQLKVNTFYEY